MIEIVTNTGRLRQLRDKFYKAPVLAFDFETNGLSIHRAGVGISFAADSEYGIYIPLQIYENGELRSPWEELGYSYIKLFIAEQLSNGKRLVGHNVIFDIKTAENLLGVNYLHNVIADTQALAHLVHNEAGPLGLKPLATELIDPNAANPQSDVKASVEANGGSATKTNFEMWKCDYEILGKYGAMDAVYTFALYEKLYPEIDRQGLRQLWEKEVLALLPVSYELNYNGIRVDLPYFSKLKSEIETEILNIEGKIKELSSGAIDEYETNALEETLVLNGHTKLGRYFKAKYKKPAESFSLDVPEVKAEALEWARANSKNKSWQFNFDSGDHKAWLIYDVLGFTCVERTETGKRSTDADTLKELVAKTNKFTSEMESILGAEGVLGDNKSAIIQLLLKRTSEKKILSTYVIPILENNIEGRIYTGFRQTGTISGRYTSSDPINLQTLPRDDQRIKKGFIPDEGDVFVAMDYESAEPKIFAFVSGEPKLKSIFSDGLDFYSKIAIDVEKLSQYSANPEDGNFLKKMDKSLRQKAKSYSLGIPYGMAAGKLSMTLGIDYNEAKVLVKDYLDAYPKLAQWMKRSEEQAYTKGYVSSLVGRRRRTKTIHAIYKKYGLKDFSKRTIEKLLSKVGVVEGYTDSLKLYLQCNNELNNAKNFQIQSLAASICNAAMIDFVNKAKQLKLQAKLRLNVHDEIIATCVKSQAKDVAKLLKECMITNWVSTLMDVAMSGDPIVTDKSLAEAK